MAAEPRYDDPCGIARAMSVIGDRWAVLVVRELMFGARRFAQLRAGLAGISPNVLSQRLRDLDARGVVRRTTIESVNVTVYELTDRGYALEPVLIELGRWGSQEQNTATSDLSPSALMFALKTVFNPATAQNGVFALALDGEHWTVTVDSGHIHIDRRPTAVADVTLVGDRSTLRSVAFGRESLDAAEAAGRLHVTGSRPLAAHFGRMFPIPTPSD